MRAPPRGSRIQGRRQELVNGSEIEMWWFGLLLRLGLPLFMLTAGMSLLPYIALAWPVSDTAHRRFASGSLPLSWG
jgi:hypothetical protein